MKYRPTSLFWVLTDLFIIFAIPFFPSAFSIFCILSAIILAPIDIWQNLLDKLLKGPIKSIIIALCVAFVIGLFPIASIVTNVVKLANPKTYAPQNTSSVTYYEEHSSNTNEEVSEQSTTSEETSSQVSSNYLTNSSNSTSNYSKTSSKNSSYKQANTSSKSTKSSSSYKSKQSNVASKKELTNSDTVYRTPSGKRYHSTSACGGKNSYAVTYEEATKANLTPCKKCYK